MIYVSEKYHFKTFNLLVIKNKRAYSILKAHSNPHHVFSSHKYVHKNDILSGYYFGNGCSGSAV